MKVQKRGYDFKKHIIHVLVAGAMAVSWGAVSHVNEYIHTHLKAAPTSRSKTKTKKEVLTPIGATPNLAEAATPPPPPPPSPPAVAAETSTTPIADTVAETTSASLVKAVAAKMGINITDTKVDANFIRKMEGSVLKGYVPLAATTRSGVTIADGFDLGQMRLSEFNTLPISSALKGKLAPYVGLIRFQAKDFLKSHPLTINEDELKELNAVAANKILKPLAQIYTRSTGKSFADLPAEAQTVIFSYAYQHGPGFMHSKAGAELWHYFTTQNWQKASAALRSSKMYASRRAQEAKLLDKIA